MATETPIDPLSAAEVDVVRMCLQAGVHSDVLSELEASLIEGIEPLPRDEVLIELIRSGNDPIGAAFSAARSPEARRPMGQFYTDEAIVTAMVKWVLGKNPVRIVDCGAGSGRFTTALIRSGFAGEIIAVDLDPLACLMTRANVAVLDTGAARVECTDFLDLDLTDAPGVTAFIGNPPYVRHHDLSQETKARAQQLASELGIKLSGLAGLHALFIIAAAQQSSVGDVGCFITSAEWLDTSYGKALRGLFAGGLGLERLDVIDPTSVAFDDAMTSAVICSWSKGFTGKAKARFVASRRDLSTLRGGKAFARDDLSSEERWSNLTRDGAEKTDGHMPLGDIFRVHRGLATGSNAFFVMTREQAIERGLIEWTSPCLTKAVQVSGDEITAAGVTHVVLDLPVELPDDETVCAYIASGEEAGVHEKYLCAHRKPWWRIGGKPAPDVVATYMGRQPPRFALNTAGAKTLNTIHGLYFRDTKLSAKTRRAVVQWLNENNAAFIGRTYHGGLMKFEPSEMSGLLVPPLAQFT